MITASLIKYDYNDYRWKILAKLTTDKNTRIGTILLKFIHHYGIYNISYKYVIHGKSQIYIHENDKNIKRHYHTYSLYDEINKYTDDSDINIYMYIAKRKNIKCQYDLLNFYNKEE